MIKYNNIRDRVIDFPKRGKIAGRFFLNDTHTLLRPSLIFNPYDAYEIAKRELIEKL